MTGFKDLFSEQADRYAQFRPSYPADLFRCLASLVQERKFAWDCGCGNGQAAVELADHFERVIATDSSEKQLENSLRHPSVVYRQTSAEDSGLEAKSVDLIVAAQSFHWFEWDRFYKEVKRVSKAGGVLALWCYGLARISPEVDVVVLRFYRDILGSYWGKERRLVEEGYRNVPFPFQEIKPPRFEMMAQWSLDQLVGYLGTWSALQAFIKENSTNPLELVYPELKVAWGNGSERNVQWELAMRVGTVHPSTGSG